MKISAYLDRAQIDRIVPFNKRDEYGMDRTFNDVDLRLVINDKEDFSLQDGDKIQVFSVLDLRQNVVNITGAVTRPGQYDIGAGLTLNDLIRKADGLLGDAYLERADIVRVNPDFTEELIKLDLSKAMNNQEDQNINLQGLDRVRIYGRSEMIPTSYVSINGHVKNPGIYVLQYGMTLYDLLFKSGGFKDPEFKKRTYLKRAELIRVKENSDEKEIIPFNLGQALEKKGIALTLLQTDDFVNIYSLNEVEGATRYVDITGHVKSPGRYELFEGNMTLYDLIFKAGGFTDTEFKKKTYLDRAELIRTRENSSEKDIIPFNLGSVLNKKDIASFILKTDDIVKIYSFDEIKGSTRFVTIEGFVKSPGQYELYEGNMTLYDLLFKAGGFNDNDFRSKVFLDRADLIRNKEDNISKKIIPFNLMEVLNDKNSPNNYKLKSEDVVRVYSKQVFNVQSSVTIEGAIRNPGKYLLKDNMTIKDLILESGGLSEKIFKYKIEIARIDPVRSNKDNYAEIINLDMLSDFSIESDENKTFLLQSYDHVFIRPDPYFKMQEKVLVGGAVNYPGYYSLVGPNETLSDIIKRAGGLKKEAYAFGSTFLRNGNKIQLNIDKIVQKPKSSENITLLEGDEIFIASQLNVIQILGEVNSPGYHKYIKRQRINDVIKSSGGYTIDAERKEVYIKYLDGNSKKYSRFFGNHKVFDGSVITVGKKKEKEPFDSTEYLKEMTSIIANLVQVISIIALAR